MENTSAKEATKPITAKEELTCEELQTLINVVVSISVPVKDAPKLIELCNKLSRMRDQSSLTSSP